MSMQCSLISVMCGSVIMGGAGAGAGAGAGGKDIKI